MKKGSNAPEISPVMRGLASYISRALTKPLPGAVTERTKHHMLDTIAAMVSGSRLLPGRRAISYAETLGGAKQACVVGTRLVTTAQNAAFANGMLAHADETDDMHASTFTHPGCGVVPAALAMAEHGKRSGVELLRAVALGYDVCARLTMSLNAKEFRADGHSTHGFGTTFGAAAAAGALAGIDERRARHLLSYTAQQASGLSTYPRDTEHVQKAFDFGGMPARNGVAAATMVAHGFTAVEDVFAGERNFFVAYGRAPDADALLRELGSAYEIMNANIKRWPVGGPIQAPLDSLLELIRTHDVKPGEIERVVVRISHYGANVVNNRSMPDICIQHLCALMLVDGTLTFSSSHDERRMRERSVLALRRRIELRGDDELERALPLRQGIVEIKMKDGRELRHHTRAVRGTSANPMTRAEVDEKGYELMAPVLGTRRARELCNALWNIDALNDVRKLRPLLQAQVKR